jgi:tetratricopeptide (TPR) repeat protein
LYSLGGLGRLDEARLELQKALDLDPLNALLNWNMGNVQLALGDTAAADAYYRRAVQFEPSQPNAYAGLGDVAIARGRLDEALRWYLDGTEQDPGHPHITAIVGLIYNALGDRERAQSWFDKAAGMLQVGSLPKLFREFVPLVVRNEDPDALLAALREVPAGQFGAFGSRLFRKAALRTGDTTGTEGFYRQNWPELFAAEPAVGASNFGAATDVAWLLMARGEAERSERLLNRALEVFHDPSQRRIDPPDWALVLVETEALALLGRKSDALAALRRAVDGGWRWDWWQVENDPTLASIRREPEFVAMIEEVKADLATQRERVRELERSDASRVVTGAEDEAR